MTPLPEAAFAAVGLAARQSIEYQNEHLYQDYTKNLGGYMIVLVLVAAGSMVMRVWCRLHIGVALAKDDYTFLVGSTIAIGSFIVMLLYAFDAGLGKHWIALTPDQRILFPKLNYAYNILNVLSYPTIKISILLFYLRIFTVLKTFSRVIWVAIAILAATALANTLITINSCTPVAAFWDPVLAAQPSTHCIDEIAYYYWTATFNCITDLFILVAPMTVIWRREIRHKVAITGLFMLGGLTFVVSILRIVYYLEYNTDDPSYSFLDSGYATPGEVCLAVIVASAPTWKPVWSFWAKRLQSWYDSYAYWRRGSGSVLDSTGTVTHTPTGERGRGRGRRGRSARDDEATTGLETKTEGVTETAREVELVRTDTEKEADETTITGRAAREGDSEVSLTRSSTGPG